MGQRFGGEDEERGLPEVELGRADQEGRPGEPRRLALAARGGPGVSLRAILIGLVLTPPNVWFLVKGLWLWGGYTGDESLFMNTVAVLFVMALGNELLKRRRPRLALRPGEILTVYVMLGVSTGLVCSVWDLGGALAGTITYPFWFATDENGWRELLWPNLPSWLTVRDRDVLAGFYVGGMGYNWQIIKQWAAPALWWASLIGALMWTCLCLNSIVRRRWADEEKLPFPITILPVQTVDESSGIWRSKLWWAAVVFAFSLGLWNTLTRLSPSLPQIPLSFDYSSYVQHRHPWDLIPYQAFTWSPFYIGLCYLMPLDLAFSLFVFDVLWIAEYVVTGHFGWCVNPYGGFPYGQDQTAGGFLALVASFVWLDRRYLAQVLRRTIGLESRLGDDAEEAFGYRAAVLGALAGVAYLWWLFARAGMQNWVIASFLGLYFALSLALSRIRAQLGPPTHSVEWAMPNFILAGLAGTQRLGPRSLGMFTLMQPYLLEQRNSPVPLQLEALKMAEGGRMERRRLAVVLAVMAPLAILCYFWASIKVGYQMGLGTGNTAQWMLSVPRWLIEDMAANLRNETGTNQSASLAMGFGVLVTVALMFLKLNVSWWPLHPVAFPIALSATIQSMTLVIFGTWLFKALLLRYGGLRAHRMVLPFFLGLLAGDATGYTIQRVILAALDIRF